MKDALKSVTALVSIGPYPGWRAEQLTELLLSSKGLYVSLEQLLRGDIRPGEFLAHLEGYVENADLFLREDEAANRDERDFEPVYEGEEHA